MLNLTDINNYLFLFFFIKNRAYKHYIYKGGEHPPNRKNKIVMRAHYPYHKQPAGSVYCGYYMCEHMRELRRYAKDPEWVSIYSLLG
jgi:hypothetical protein